MPRRWLDERAELAFTHAVEQIETVSAAEVAVAIRQRARAWPHVPFVAGAFAAWLVLALMMYSAPAFPFWSFLVDPLLAGLAAAWAISVVPPPLAWVTSASARRRAAMAAARAAFVERGVHVTRARTGLLVFCALAERVAVVVADAGIIAALPADALSAWERAIAEALPRGGAATAEAVASIAPRLAAVLPRQRDDLNELVDTIEHDTFEPDVDRRPRS
jgi:putative membrane protein